MYTRLSTIYNTNRIPYSYIYTYIYTSPHSYIQVITEEELAVAISTRERSYKRLNRMQRSLLTTTSTFQPYIFCAHLALELCNMSNEAYFNYSDNNNTTTAKTTNTTNSSVTPTVGEGKGVMELQYSSYRALDLG